MDVRDLERLFERIVLGQKGSIALIRFDGELLAHYPNYEPPLSADTAAELRANGLLRTDRKIVRLTDSSDGKEHLVAIRALAHYPAVIAVRTNVWADFSNWKIR